MSINVTVTGNPIKIHRGKLITTDLQQDVDKRRKMRLQQVRQQSKELAASVRNNVKKVKSKQQTNFEKENQTKLKEWQNKKMLQLQNVYEENVKDIGIGHAQAQINEIEEMQEMERQKIINDERASRRGRSAQEMLQVKKNEQNLQKAIPRQAKQIAREVENARAAMIVSQATHKTPKKRVTKGSFTIVEHNSEVVPDQDDVDNIQASTSRNVIPTPKSAEKIQEQKSYSTVERIEPVPTLTSLESYQRAEITKSPTKRFRHENTSRVSIVSLDIPPDTRISDRIRSRHLVTAMSDIAEASSNEHLHESHDNKENKDNRNLNRGRTFSRTTQPGVSIPPTMPNEVITCPVCIKHANPFSHTCACPNANPNVPRIVCVPNIQTCPNSASTQAQSFEIPSKPTVKLASENYTPQYSQHDTNSTNTKEYRKVRSFDRNNRFGHHYITDTTHVHRIQDDELAYSDDLEAGPSSRHAGPSREFTKMADERAKMANVRGKKALEKENIHKDYEQLMKKLPLLQKQGRIANLNPSSDKLHMSDDRKRDHEKHRQQKMERAFEKVAPTTAPTTTTTITIPPSAEKRNPSPKLPKSPPKPRTTQETTNIPKKPVAGTWKKSTVEAGTSASPDTSNLISLLEKLRSQKEELLKESKDLPQDSNFYNFIEDLDFVAGTNKKTQHKDKKVQTSASKQSGCDVPRKVHKQVLILQNTSTQTSPKISNANSCNTECSSDAEPPTKQPKTEAKKEADKKESNVCACKDRDKLCEILIKIRDCTAHSSDHKFDSKESVPDVTVNRRKVEETEQTSKSRKTNHVKSDDSDASINPKRSRSESPKKTPRKIENVNENIRKLNISSINQTNNGKNRQQSSRFSNDSWKHQFSTSSVRNPDEITSGTSYYSPPDYNLQANARKPNTNCQPENVTSIMYQKVQEIPLDTKLLSYINKILDVSKSNLNRLANNVSSISEVATPASSVINMRSNRPQRAATNTANSHNDSTQIEKLSTLLKYFNLTPGDFTSFVSVQSTSSQPRTRSNSVGSSTTQSTQSRNSRSATPQTVGNGGLSLEHYTQTPSTLSDPVVDQFAQWAEICQARISNLTEMIDKVRMEKKEMLSPKDDNVTSYMNLPQTSRSTSLSPHSPSLEQRQLDQQLLDVHDGAKSRRTIARNTKPRELIELSKTHPDLDRDIVARYMKLVDVELQAQKSKTPEQVEGSPRLSSGGTSEKNVSFKPMLDIPKLPKFQPQPQASTASGSSSSHVKGKKPPVTSNALRFNDVIHELSAIPEAENSRLSKSPASKKSSPQKRMVEQRSQTAPSRKQPTTKTATEVSEESPASEKSNESVESMLKTIGLDWAINTLKIMNAANNNSSSSTSSFDIDQKKFSFLVSKNVSTSTEKANVSPNDLSRHQRTSTPVQTTNSSKSQPSHRLINSGESEISPVPCGQPGLRRGKDKSPCYDSSQLTFHTLPSQSILGDSDS